MDRLVQTISLHICTLKIPICCLFFTFTVFHQQIKDSNIPNDGHDVERKTDTETEKISSTKSETESIFEAVRFPQNK